MTIRNIFLLTALVAVGFALLRPLFGIAVFLLAFTPLVATQLFSWNDLRLNLRRSVMIVCLIPLWAVSMGPYISIQTAIWGNTPRPTWINACWTMYKPFNFVWRAPSIRPYGWRFEETWQNLGYTIGRGLQIHDFGRDMPVFQSYGRHNPE